jgi:hypothetical protein
MFQCLLSAHQRSFVLLLQLRAGGRAGWQQYNASSQGVLIVM